MKILNGQEAFAALTTGQNIECRHMQSSDFNDIRNFPATVYVDPEYEFRIAIKFFTIGEMQVPEPIQEAPIKGIQCFVPSILTEVLSKSFKWKSSDSDLALLQRGQVHLVQEHANTHALALITISGGSIETPAETTSDDVENKPSDEAKVWKTSAQETHELLAETREMAEAMMVDTTHGPVLNSFALEVEQEIAADEVIKHQEHLNEILNDIALANTPAEANAHIRYTRSWTEEQRKPVMTAINKRLVELTAINPVEVSQPPSLMVRIQSALTEHELNELLPEVRTRHPDIQPKLMDCVKKRRFELENQVVTL